MITTSNAFNECVRQSSRTFRVRFLKNGEPLNCEVKKVVTRKGACTEEFSPGMVYAPYIDAELLSCEASIENEELLLQAGLYLDDETVEYINIGYFTVTKPERNAYQTTFQAVGRISSRLNVLPDLPEVKSLSNLANAITEKTGIRILTKGLTLGGTITADLNGMTCREILEVITSVLGGFSTEDGDGNIVICKFSTTSLFQYNGDYVITPPKFNDYNYTVDGIKVVVSPSQTDETGNTVGEAAFIEGTGVPKITLSNRYMTAALFKDFVQNLIGYSFRPGEMQLTLGDPRIEPWDCLSYTDAAGVTYTLPCLNLVHTFDGGFSTEISAKGKNDADLQIKGPMQKQLDELRVEVPKKIGEITKNLLGQNGGYFALTYDEQGFPDGWVIMDTPSLTPTTKLWKMSAGGFGYSKDGGQTFTNLAFDLEGNFYANAITAGVLDCADIVVKNLNAQSIMVGTISKDQLDDEVNESIDNAIDSVKNLEERANNGEFKGEDGTVLRIDSSRGTVFKNNAVSTVLSVVIFRGSKQIKNMEELHAEFGTGAYLQWYWQRLDDDAFGIMSSADERFSNGGFSLTLTPEDVSAKVTFRCELIV